MLSQNLNICGGYDSFFAHLLILGRNSNICGCYDSFFCSSSYFGAPLTKGSKRIFCPAARNFSRRPCSEVLYIRVLQAPRPSPISLNHFLVLQFDHLTMNMKFRDISLMFTSATEAILRPTFLKNFMFFTTGRQSILVTSFSLSLKSALLCFALLKKFFF